MKVGYTVRRSKRARAMRISVYPGGAVVVTAPYRFGLGAIERFVARYASWV